MVKGYGIEHDVSMAAGQSRELGSCNVAFTGMDQRKGPNYDAQVGYFSLRCGNHAPRLMISEKRSYVASAMPLTESAIDWGFTRDIYVALSAPLNDDASVWSVRVQYKPFMRWVWLGVLMMGAGALVAALARRLRRSAAQHPQAESPA
jgi:cytochrome c-type biogenesis protein CcmF